MTTALYRRYRPEAFGEMIGQAQVTEPLMTALRSDRVGHAYLFSGPRGCGKTTSARILARCLNCAEGPTDVPCGKCDSCVELGRGGGGSLDVVEIDAASHNGVDDARDLRERAIFAPARDRFKIFILDEAHMVTPQGFNALLKLIEEPPDHVKFIFATTEPEKVIGTIRSRTHHYPFRLVPAGAMLAYVEELCETEGVTVESGVLPLVVRAGGGSPRDTLSLLDQLIAGSEGPVVAYKRAVALLGYTHAELLDEVVDAFAATDASAAFAAIDRVIQTGQDPRRFVDDLLERLRDLIIVSATGQGAAAVLRGVSAEDLQRMSRQAGAMGTSRLSQIADLVIATLDDMTGATSPRLQLELMVARVLASAAAAGLVAAPPAVQATAAVVAAPAGPAATSASAPASTSVPERTSVPEPTPVPEPVEGSLPEPTSVPEPVEGRIPEPTSVPEPVEGSNPERTAQPPAPEVVAPSTVAAPTGPVTLQRMRDAWPQVLARLESVSRSSWLLASGADVAALDGDVLTLTFQSQTDVAKFKQLSAGAGPSEDLRAAIVAVLGLRVKYIAKFDSDRGPASRGDDGGGTPPPRAGGPGPAKERPAPARASTAPVTEWAVARIPGAAPADDAGPEASIPQSPSAVAQFAIDDEPEDVASDAVRLRTATLAPAREGEVLPTADVAPSIEPDDDDSEVEPEVGAAFDAPVPPAIAPPLSTPPRDAGRRPPSGSRPGQPQRYGEAVVRQVLSATFVREEPYEAPTRFS